jgi:hypothetical protein
MTPLSNDPVTIPCPVCETPFEPVGKRRYCRDACRVAAHRRRHATAHPLEDVPPAPPREPRRARTVYQCPTCDGRVLGEQRCNDCGTFMRRLGTGGPCPCCDEPVTIDELLNP